MYHRMYSFQCSVAIYILCVLLHVHSISVYVYIQCIIACRSFIVSSTCTFKVLSTCTFNLCLRVHSICVDDTLNVHVDIHVDTDCGRYNMWTIQHVDDTIQSVNVHFKYTRRHKLNVDIHVDTDCIVHMC